MIIIIILTKYNNTMIEQVAAFSSLFGCFCINGLSGTKVFLSINLELSSIWDLEPCISRDIARYRMTPGLEQFKDGSRKFCKADFRKGKERKFFKICYYFC